MATEAGFRPTTRCTVYRTDDPSNEVDEFGDEVDNNTEAATGLPFSISHTSTKQYLPSENRLTVVHEIVARTRAKFNFHAHDRLKDERTGDVYMIESLVAPQDPFGSAAIRMTLRHVNSDGQAF